ncbi:hypothetical protein OAV62_01640 [bacterium]|nr:hypothetical protein [bacterium]
MKSLQTIILEALVVGFILIPFVYVTAFIAKPFMKSPKLPAACKQWNKYFAMEINLLIAGFLFHFVLEYLGVNKWYVDNYYK